MDIKLLDKEEKKVRILAELLTGKKPRALAEEYDVHYATVMTWKRESKEQKVESAVLDVAEADADVLHLVTEGIKKQSAEVLPPKQANSVIKKVDELKEGVNSLQLLDTAFHDTIMNLLTWANAQINEDMALKDWKLIANQIGELHSAIFSKGGTTVNMMQQNNSANSSRVETFKGSFRD